MRSKLRRRRSLPLRLPWNLQARAGRFFADFGRLSKFHPHEYPFVNTPLIDGANGRRRIQSRRCRAELSRSHAFLSCEQPWADTTKWVRKTNDWTIPSHAPGAALLIWVRLQTYFDLTDNHSIELGTSLAYTPSIRILEDPHGGSRSLAGVDLTYRYQPLGSTLYQGFTLGGELFGNSERVELEAGISAHAGSWRLHLCRSKINETGPPAFFSTMLQA